MKTFLFVGLVLVSALYAAESQLILSDEVIAFGDDIVKTTIDKVHEDATGLLTGSVYESYLNLYKVGFKNVILEDEATVAKALEYLNALSDKENESEIVKQSISAFEEANSLPKGAELETFVAAWAKELRLSFEALKVVAEKDLPESFSKHHSSAQIILLNNGKTFSAACMAAFQGGLLASLAGYEKRKQTMGSLDLIQTVRERAYSGPTK